jgi:tRNA G10  N-methylase Trm11
MKYFLIFGTHPLLSLAETKAVLGGERPEMAGGMAIFEREDWDGVELQKRLAGTVKLGEVIDELPVKEATPERLADLLEAHPKADRVDFGLTVYGGSAIQKQKLKGMPLKLKRVLQERGHAVRWVTGDKGEVSPAAVAKAGLITKGYDLCLAVTGEKVVVGLTTNVQDADAWSQRDFGRPFRDQIAGMLPPKLARMMVNLAGQTKTLLDPFCGGGTILMEAALINSKAQNPNLKIIGSDIDQRQITGAEENLEWLVEQGILKTRQSITTLVSAVQDLKGVAAGTVVTEGHLGRPLTGQETLPTLNKQKEEIEKLWREAFASLAKIQKPGSRLVCVWPVFASSHGTLAVDLYEEIEALGYRQINPLEGWTDKPATLTYSRPEQRVKRNIVVLERA